jgi:hypothetical protein
MSFWRLPAQMREHAGLSMPATTRLSGRWLLLARLAWIVLVLFVLGATIASLPASFAVLHLPCTFDNVTCNSSGLLTASQIQALPKNGFSLDAHAWSYLGTSGFLALVSIVLGAVIFWRKSDDWMALLVVLLLIGTGTGDIMNPLQFSSSIWGVLYQAVSLFGIQFGTRVRCARTAGFGHGEAEGG